jgi:hypothetical protein
MDLFDNKQLNQIFRNIKKDKSEEIIHSFIDKGDMDFQAWFITKVLTNPKIFSLGLKTFLNCTISQVLDFINL